MLSPRDIAIDGELFSEKFLRILNKQEQLVPFKWNSIQRKLHASKTGRDLVLKSRQVGISTYEQGEIFRSLVTHTTRALTLSHDDTTTQILRQTADRFWEHCRFNNFQPSKKYSNATMTTYPDFDSMHVIGTAGNTEVGRGGSYSRIHGSEVAKWKDANKLIAGAMQGGNPAVVLESTPNGAQGVFYEMCMEAMRGEGVWKLHFFPWWEDVTYKESCDSEYIVKRTDEEINLSKKHNLDDGQILWRRRKQLELKARFPQEYPEDPISCFLTSGNSYFGDLSNSFGAPLEPLYNPSHEYIAGLDFGQTNDFTAMPVLDLTAKVQVDLLHIRKLEWAEQRRRIKQTYFKWHCSRMGAEKNSIGSPNIEALQADGINVIPFETTNFSKSEIMANLYEGLHTDGLQLQDISEQRHELNTFISTQTSTGLWRLAASKDGHDDIVLGLAIAWNCKGIDPSKMVDWI